MRIDAHFHLWEYNREDYGWMEDGYMAIAHDMLPSQLEPELRAAQIDLSVAVQARQTLRETEWLLQIASRSRHKIVVVGWVDLCSPDVARQIECYCADPAFKGVRHFLSLEPDDSFMLRADFRRGLEAVAACNLSFDLLVFPRQLAAAAQLVEQLPELRFVLDHLGNPDIANDQQQPWADDLRRLAQYPNVWCKVSGLLTIAPWNRWTPNLFAPYLDAAFDAFGEDRLLFGSDWPVCTCSGTYGDTVALVENYLAQRAPSALSKVMGLNAATAYQIDISGMA